MSASPLFYLNKLSDNQTNTLPCLSLPELLDLPGNKNSCYIFNYMYDYEWMNFIIPEINNYKNLHFIGQSDCIKKNEMLLFFPKAVAHTVLLPITYGTHHTKMIVLYHDDSIRIIITTCNMVSGDWNYKNQGIWYNDFILKNNNAKISLFENDLLEYLSHYPASLKSLCDIIKKFDYSLSNAILIGSVPGYHKGNDINKYGHMKVRKYFKSYNVSKSSHLWAQFSSLGSLSEKWISEFTISFYCDKLRCIWPTVENVRTSVEGYKAGCSLPSASKNVEKIIPYLYKWDGKKSKRNQNMPHIKSYYSLNNNKEFNFCLLTSSNLSGAAWGTLQKNSSQLLIRSYELGLLFLPSYSESISSVDRKRKSANKVKFVSDFNNGVIDLDNDEDFNEILMPLPYNITPSMYDKNDKPWAWDIQYTDYDNFGSTYNP